MSPAPPAPSATLAAAKVAPAPPLNFEVEFDERGDERRAGEVLFMGRPAELDRVETRGFVVLSREVTPAGVAIARIQTQPGASIEATAQRLQALAPAVSVSANSIYRLAAGEAVRQGAGPGRAAPPVRRGGGSLVGVIDTGADLSIPKLRAAIVDARGFSRAGYRPAAHGTQVASIAADLNARLLVADVFDTDSRGAPAATADSIARALAWLMSEGAPVVNISIAGPSNPTLERLVGQARAKGHVVVAAAGNGGASAPPAHPAAFRGAVAVTAVDQQDRPYWRANRGDYISFAALGVEVPVALGARQVTVSGTSFSSPVVAVALARRLATASRRGADRALKDLQNEAKDLGAPSRDPIYGWGRVSP